jgi:hypothetical protein
VVSAELTKTRAQSIMAAPWVTGRARGVNVGGGRPDASTTRWASGGSCRQAGGSRKRASGAGRSRGSPRQMAGPTGSRLECRESSGHRIKPESNVDQITPKKWAVGPVQQLAWDRTGERSGSVRVPDRAGNDSVHGASGRASCSQRHRSVRRTVPALHETMARKRSIRHLLLWSI